MEKIVFLVYHGFGHFNSCFGLARNLSLQYIVIFAGDSFFENYVKAQGFSFHSLNSVPFGLGFEKWTLLNLNRSYFNIIEEFKCRRKNELLKSRYQDLTKLLHSWKPNYLLIDSLQSTDFIVIYNELKTKNIKVAFIQTMLSTVITKGYPELNNPANPEQLLLLRKFQKKSELQWRLTSLFTKIKYLGYDNESLIKRRFKGNSIPLKYYTNRRSVAGWTFNHVKELILAPREFEYPNYQAQPHQHHIGFVLDHKRVEISDPRYLGVLEKIQNNVINSNHILIYCSFGTVKSSKIKRLTALISKIIDAVSEKDCCSLIISSTNFSDFENGRNVFVLKAVPQVDILNYSNIFITHGGLNSIKESIDAEVPMIVYPIDSNLDQVGNAARVSYHRLGILGSFDDTADNIRARMEELLIDPSYLNSLRKFRNHEESYSSEMAASFLKSLEIQ